MRFAFIAVALLLMVPQVSEADCWRQKQAEILKIKKQVIVALEKIDAAKWKFGSSKELKYVKVTKNKKEITVSVSDWGTLSVDHQTIDLPDRLQNRLKRLYRKIACQKVFREVLLMKEFLGTI
jgi:hypothetical protein